MTPSSFLTDRSTSVRVAITTGDPAGIGPELVARLLTEIASDSSQPVVVYTTAAELDRAFDQAGSGADRAVVDGAEHITIVETGADFADMPVGVASERGGRWALNNLELALAAHERDEVDAIVFAPLNKSSLHQAGMHENDELRWFEKRLGVTGVVSELNAISGLWTSRVTSHVSHRDAPAQITADRVRGATGLLNAYLVGSGVPKPRIAVCALNPHGGEGGKFGSEEIDEIAPGIALARASGIDAVGPFPADTLFLRARDGDFDGVVTMYHDQGQIAMKMIGFDGGVTVEGGIGIAVCTPAHGTAFDRVGMGTATVTSTRNAYLLARSLAATSTALTA
ncbi:4-hydroxythreonine-4-phosphate dehydrogenase [Cryobacterium adonitolivorans]|uniref:4-hydroxythreonine-4-phosphate dehydrogenase n=1 Tax=Cryobacterium adonitolivorans TaxID=1259189 RepID=A0A4R8W3H9_9MICO|nr:4-hydroxythreonine-4-phosphate dehydrogenase PdxA [Cryobacterium adonitolivorans]TFB99550.1 4-hydroxythreonine-4-phosphate dehydrogenase [Cryobacterium adonitolivorans]